MICQASSALVTMVSFFVRPHPEDAEASRQQHLNGNSCDYISAGCRKQRLSAFAVV